MIQDTAISRYRSFSLSCYMNGPAPDTDTTWGVQPLRQTSQIQNTSKTLTFIDEDALTLDDGHFLYSTDTITTTGSIFPAGGIKTAPFSPLPTPTRNTGSGKARSLPQPDFDGGGGLTDPAALEDLNHLQQTAPGSN